VLDGSDAAPEAFSIARLVRVTSAVRSLQRAARRRAEVVVRAASETLETLVNALSLSEAVVAAQSSEQTLRALTTLTEAVESAEEPATLCAAARASGALERLCAQHLSDDDPRVYQRALALASA